MEAFDVYKTFITERLNEAETDEIFSLMEADAPLGKPAEADDRYPLDTLMKKDADKLLELRDEVEKKIKDGTFTAKDGIDLAEKVLFVKTAINMPKEKRQIIYNQVKEIYKEKDEARKNRLAKKISFDAIKLIDENRTVFDMKVKQRKIFYILFQTIKKT